MTAEDIKGTPLAKAIRAQVQQTIGTMGIAPKLAVIQVGDNQSNLAYADEIKRIGTLAGIEVDPIHLPETATEDEIKARIEALNADAAVNGILTLLPLPGALNNPQTRRAIIEAIDPAKDIDGVHSINQQLLAAQSADGLRPCTPTASMRLLDQAHPEGLAGKKAVMVGMSDVMGAPMAEMLRQRDCDVTGFSVENKEGRWVCIRHRWEGGQETREEITPEQEVAEAAQADIAVVAIGNKEFVKATWIKPGATVIDVGINVAGDKIYGDVDYNAVRDVAGKITPVPSGVGPVTNAVLMESTLKAYLSQHHEVAPEAVGAENGAANGAGGWAAGAPTGTTAPVATRGRPGAQSGFAREA